MIESSGSERYNVDDAQAAAIPQKLTCNKANELLNGLQGFMGTS
jgi:hypothetical protein